MGFLFGLLFVLLITYMAYKMLKRIIPESEINETIENIKIKKSIKNKVNNFLKNYK